MNLKNLYTKFSNNNKPSFSFQKFNPKRKKQNTQKLDNIIAYTIALIFFLTPLYFTSHTFQNLAFAKTILFQTLTLFGLLTWAIKIFKTGELKLIKTPLDIPIFATLTLFIISTISSINTKDSLLGSYNNFTKSLLTVCLFVLFYYLLVNNLNKKTIKLTFFSIITSISSIILISIAQLNGLYLFLPTITHTITFTPLNSLTALSNFLTISLPLLIIISTHTQKICPTLTQKNQKILKSLFITITFLNVILLATLNKFTFLPIAIIGLIILLIFFFAQIVKISKINLLIPTTIIITISTFLVLENFNFHSLNLPSEISLPFKETLNITKNSILENPLFGSGPSTFYYNFAKFKNTSFNQTPLWNTSFTSSHSTLLELISTLGTLGTLSLILLALLSLSFTYNTVLKTDDQEIKPILLGLLATFTSIIISAIYIPQNNSIILISTLLAIFISASSLTMHSGEFKTIKIKNTDSQKSALLLSSIIAITLISTITIFSYNTKSLLADIHTKNYHTSNPSNKEPLEKAIKLKPKQSISYSFLAKHYSSQINNENLLDNYNQAVKNINKAISLNPKNVDYQKQLALIHEDASSFTRESLTWAEEQYTQIIKLDPNNPNSYIKIAIINTIKANRETNQNQRNIFLNNAINYFDQAITKKNNLSISYYGKAIAYERLNNLDRAIEHLKQAHLLSPNNPNYQYELARLLHNRGVAQENPSEPKAQLIANNINPRPKSKFNILTIQLNKKIGAIIGKNQDLQDSEQLLNQVLSSHPNHANALYSLATLQQKTGNKKQAQTLLEKLYSTIKDQSQIKKIKSQFK